ncbi:hypothetical protein M0D68_11565 [Paraburkholderia sp. SEWSISQ10-3 4]|uniref:hypothetical protein n=1 Tax=Paraburkholderia TaxID=1822464 RepID=UPI00224FBB0F|nr:MULTISPECIES: hypothetical protein [Paraburkholderia]MCX4138821.1 hypothetical protein [Paraburkholderia aspalathi]MDN7171511.1 hypothetical protein [Paraburkholderia sp. SEWSISQ10-3 4]MDQ6501150.1 hypothetical protein [Paraburkholderia aspalathi]
MLLLLLNTRVCGLLSSGAREAARDGDLDESLHGLKKIDHVRAKYVFVQARGEIQIAPEQLQLSVDWTRCLTLRENPGGVRLALKFRMQMPLTRASHFREPSRATRLQ